MEQRKYNINRSETDVTWLVAAFGLNHNVKPRSDESEASASEVKGHAAACFDHLIGICLIYSLSLCVK